jgi:hypothetical protein
LHSVLFLNSQDDIMRSKYIISVFIALTFGFGVAFWRATDEFGRRVEATTHLAAMTQTQLAAEEQAKALSEKLDDETKAREAAEQARDNAANRAANLAQQLANQLGVTRKITASLADADVRVRALSAELRQETSDKEAADTAGMEAEAEAQATIEKLALRIKAREVASKRSQTAKRASPDHRHRIRRQNQVTALLRTKKQHPVPAANLASAISADRQ